MVVVVCPVDDPGFEKVGAALTTPPVRVPIADPVTAHQPPRRLRIFVPSVRTGRHYWPTFLEPVGEGLGVAPAAHYQRSEAGKWASHGAQLLELAGPAGAEIGVLPFSLDACVAEPELRGVAVRLAADARERGLSMLVFSRGDVEASFLPPNCVVLSRDLHRGRISPTDVPTPTWIEDPAERVALSQRPWTERPVVNFVGQAYPLGVQFGSRGQAVLKWTKALVRAGATAINWAERLDMPPYHAHRLLGVFALQRARGLDARVQLRSSMTRLDLERPEDRAPYLKFLETISGSDYTLAPRGEANHSYRLYESLACGRPAIVIDSRMALPCSEVPWSELVLEVKLRALPRFGHHVRSRHAEVERNWTELQRRCRAYWSELLSADGYFTRLVQRITTVHDAGQPETTDLARELR